MDDDRDDIAHRERAAWYEVDSEEDDDRGDHAHRERVVQREIVSGVYDARDYITHRERVLVNILIWMGLGGILGVFWREVIGLIVRRF